MSETLAPRGPDDSGIVSYGNAGFGHRRLRIIDLSEKARQPMVDGMLGLTIAFNGCIYNYPELRRELEAAGYSFFSNGDTEVILKAWHAWGEACVERFNGMFAFVIQERDSGRIIMARDRFGIKPLYLSQSGNRLRFASSLPALLKAGDVDTSIDRVALHHYMSFHAVVPPPRTIINGVRKLPPATMRIIEADGQFEDRRYWDPPFGRAADESTLSATDWRDRLLEELRAAVKRRMVADVPVGVLLSGGVDSSLIVGLLAEAGQTGLMSFSVGFEEANGEKGDEFVYSDLIAKEFGTDHHKIFVPSDGLMDALPGTFAGDVGADGLLRQCRLLPAVARRSPSTSRSCSPARAPTRCSAATTGTRRSPTATMSSATTPSVFFDRNHETLRRQLGADWTDERDYSRELVAAELQRPGADTPVDRALRLDSTVMLVDDPVKRVDNMTMAWGLEARVPVPRPRTGRTRRPHPARAEAQGQRQGHPQGRRPHGHPERGDRPQEGLLPGAAAQICRRPLSRHGARCVAVSYGARARPVPGRLSERSVRGALGSHHPAAGVGTLAGRPARDVAPDTWNLAPWPRPTETRRNPACRAANARSIIACSGCACIR